MRISRKIKKIIGKNSKGSLWEGVFLLLPL